MPALKEKVWDDLPYHEFSRIACGIRYDLLHRGRFRIVTDSNSVQAYCDSESVELSSPLVRRATDHWTLLHWICNKDAGSDELLLRLIDAGVPVDAKCMNGDTALLSAAKIGSISKCNVLLSRSASLGTTDEDIGKLLDYALTSRNAKMVEWVFEQTRRYRFQWNQQIFEQILEHAPGAASAYLDKFSTAEKYNCTCFFDLRLICGGPDQNLDKTVLAVLVKENRKDVLLHRVIKYIIAVKIYNFRWILVREISAYVGLLLSYYATIFSKRNVNWIALENAHDYGVMISRIFAWLCCLYLVIYVEYREYTGGKYFRSIWNWLNMITYAVILASIPIECRIGTTSSTRHGLLAPIVALLWANLPQYLRLFKGTGLLIATMRHMMQDVRQFVVFYAVFLFGISGGLHAIFYDIDGYKTFLDTIMTVLLMLFGNLTYDPFQSTTGWSWFFSNLLLVVYLVCVVIMLLNVLIAMMTTSFESVREEAIEQFWLHKVELVLRIERSLSPSLREKLFKQLVSGVNDQSHAKNAVFPSEREETTENKVLSLEAVKSQPTRITDCSEYKKLAERPLDDGFRMRFKLQSENKNAALSAELEARFDSLQAAVNEEISKQVCALQATIIELHASMRKEMEKQSRAVTASIMSDIQKQLHAFHMLESKKLNSMDNEIQEFN